MLTCLLAIACSDRERANPLDPHNPATNGAPTGFQAAANRDIATLTWDSMDVKGLEEYRIYRSVGGDSLRFRASVPDESTSFQDLNLMYDTTYTYAVQAITEWGESRLSPTDTLIPGPYNFWVADFNSGVWRISYDGSHVLGRDYEYFNSPKAIIYQSGENRIWVADYYDQAVYFMGVNFTGTGQTGLTGRPIDIAADPSSDGVFILQITPDAIYYATPAGTTLITNKIPVVLDPDASFTLDLQSSSLWLSTPTGFGDGVVYCLRPPVPGGSWEPAASVPYPRKVAADPVVGGCWVATDSGVVRIDAARQVATYLPQLKIMDISLNPTNGDCYYIGRSHQGWQWQTGRLFGQPEPHIILEADYSNLTGIEVLPGEGQTGFWISQAQSVYSQRILRFDRDGDLIGWLGEFYNLLDFALE
ncbi:MAG: fibronectin type III domain-containing protein [Fidelibacterota bacterium]|nr:MAG: fibronectin type III domain-containing protein [Candidatus Neomarinimicrobiota bacterium]